MVQLDIHVRQRLVRMLDLGSGLIRVAFAARKYVLSSAISPRTEAGSQ